MVIYNTALNGKIYVVGGHDDNGAILKSGAVYDPATDSWSATASMSAARAFLNRCSLPSPNHNP